MFLHATCYSPGKSTLTKAVNNGNLETWPGLTSELISGHLPKPEATIFWHLDQTPKDTRSTSSEQLVLDMETYSSIREEDKNYLFAAMVLAEPDNRKLYTYLTGLFTVTTNSGI